MPHTADSSLDFTINEQTDGKGKGLRYDLKTGKGSVISEATGGGGGDPCHVVMSGNELMVANVSPWFLNNPSAIDFASSILPETSLFIPSLLVFPYLSPKPKRVVSFIGSGSIISRQEASHPHQVVVHPTREEVLVPDLGSDKIWRLSRDGSEYVGDQGHIGISAGGGLRHAVVLGKHHLNLCHNYIYLVQD